MTRTLSLLPALLLGAALHAQAPFDAPKAVDRLYDQGLVAPHERDSLLHWLQHPRTADEYAYPMSPDSLGTPEGLLVQLGLFSYESAEANSAAFYNALYGDGTQSPDPQANDDMQAYMAALYGHPSPGKDFFEDDLTYPRTDSLLARHAKLAQALIKAGLLTQEMVQQLPKEEDYVTDLNAFYQYMASVCRYQRNYAQLRDLELRKARNLVEAGILTQDGLKHLHMEYKAGVLFGDCGLAGYAERGYVLTGDSLPEDLLPYLENAGQQLLLRLPLKGATRFRVSEVTSLDLPENYYLGNDEGTLYLASVDHNGRTYEQVFFVPMYDHTASGVGLSELRMLFNKLLADNESPYRLHHVEALDFRGSSVYDRAAMIYLTEVQYKSWEEEVRQDNLLVQFTPWFTVSEEDHGTELSPRKVEQLLQEMQELGFMDHIGADQMQSVKANAGRLTLYGPQDLMRLIPGYVMDIAYWVEEEPTYEHLLTQLSAFSHGAFKPTKIKDGSKGAKPGEAFHLAFKLKKKHSVELLLDSPGSVDFAFYPALEKASAECEGGQFYLVMGENALIFPTDKQYRWLLVHCPEIFEEATMYYEGE